jgi:glycosyltransferase involved in cell wall biosynthesis
MKIVIDARLYGTKHTGNGRYTMNLVQELIKFDKKNEYFILLRKDDFDNLVFPKKWTKVLADFKHYSFSEQFRLPVILYKIKPDIVHFPHFNIPILYFRKFVVTIHDIIMHRSKGGEATTRPFPIYQIWRLGYHISFAFAVYRSTKIIVPTNTVKNEICKYYKIKKSKVITTYEGMDAREKEKDFNASKLGKYFCYVGNAYPHKNIPRLLEAFSLFNNDRKEKINLAISSARTVFIERIANLAKKLGVLENVKLLGYVPDNQLISFYSKSVAFIYPTLIEGFGLQGLEAMKAETLVYLSDIPVLREIYKDKVEYFNPYDVLSIKKVLEKAINCSNKDRRKITNSYKNYPDNFSWAKLAKETQKIYESC